MRRRASLTHLMGLIAILALGLGAMKIATDWLARGMVLGTFVVLLVVTLGAFVRLGNRSGWIGYAVFGWAHVIVVVISPFTDAIFSSGGNDEDVRNVWRVDGLAEALTSRLHPELPQPVRTPRPRGIPLSEAELKFDADFEANSARYEARLLAADHSRAIGVAIQGMAFALVGAVTGRVLSERSTNAGASSCVEATTSPV